MSFLFNLLTDIYNIVVTLLPVACYLVGGCLIVGSILALWRMGDSTRHGRGQTALTLACFFVGIGLLNFPTFLTTINRTLGFTKTVSIGGSLLAYQTQAPSITGGDPVSLFLSLMSQFSLFFAALGALFAFRGLMQIVKGVKEQRSFWFPALISIIAGGLLMNVDVWVPGLLPH